MSAKCINVNVKYCQVQQYDEYILMVTLYNKFNVHTNGAFSLRGMTRLGTARLGSVCISTAV